MERLAAEPEVVGADLGRKALRHFAKQRLFLLSVRIRRPWHGFPDRDRAAALVQRLSSSLHLPGRVLVFAPMGGFRALGRNFTRFPTPPCSAGKHGLKNACPCDSRHSKPRLPRRV